MECLYRERYVTVLVPVCWVRLSPTHVQLTVCGETNTEQAMTARWDQGSHAGWEKQPWGEESARKDKLLVRGCLSGRHLISWWCWVCDLRSASAVGKTSCQVLGTRVCSKVHKPPPLSSRNFESRVRLTATNDHTGKMKWGLGRWGDFAYTLLPWCWWLHGYWNNFPHSIRDLPFHLSPSPASSLY